MAQVNSAVSSDDEELFQLDQQAKEIEARRKAILGARRTDDLIKAKKLIEQHSFTAKELGLEVRQSEKRDVQKPTREPKYQHPEKPELQWHGHKGARPKWVKEWLKEGHTLEQLLLIQPQT